MTHLGTPFVPCHECSENEGLYDKGNIQCLYLKIDIENIIHSINDFSTSLAVNWDKYICNKLSKLIPYIFPMRCCVLYFTVFHPRCRRSSATVKTRVARLLSINVPALTPVTTGKQYTGRTPEGFKEISKSTFLYAYQHISFGKFVTTDLSMKGFFLRNR